MVENQKDSLSRGSEKLGMTLPAGDMDNPLHITGIALKSSLKREFRLSLRFQIIRRYCGIKSKTLIRILFTKWWNQGLEWYERQMLEILLNSTGILPEYCLLRECENSLLSTQVERLELEYSALSIWLTDLPKLMYSPRDLKAVMGLKRIKTFFEHAFERKGPEQSGKPRLKRQRIRGYRDGKGKPMDPGLRDVIEANRFYYNLIENHLDEFLAEVMEYSVQRE